MKRLVLLAAALLVASTTALAAPAGAAPISATATAVAASVVTSCGDNPSFDVSGATVGDGFGSDGWGTEAGDPVPTPDIDTSPLYDNWVGDTVDWAVIFPADAVPGTIRGLYAVIGTPDLDPATSMEWFLLYSCATPGTDSTVLLECFGPVGTCPRSVDEAMAFDAEISPTDPRPGSDITVSATGCIGGLIGGGLADDEGILTQFEPQPGTTAGVTGSLTVPPEIAVGTTLHVLVICTIEGVPFVEADVVVSDGGSTTTTTTGGSTTTSTSTSTSTRPADRVTPRFAG